MTNKWVGRNSNERHSPHIDFQGSLELPQRSPVKQLFLVAVALETRHLVVHIVGQLLCTRSVDVRRAIAIAHVGAIVESA